MVSLDCEHRFEIGNFYEAAEYVSRKLPCTRPRWVGFLLWSTGERLASDAVAIVSQPVRIGVWSSRDEIEILSLRPVSEISAIAIFAGGIEHGS